MKNPIRSPQTGSNPVARNWPVQSSEKIFPLLVLPKSLFYPRRLIPHARALAIVTNVLQNSGAWRREIADVYPGHGNTPRPHEDDGYKSDPVCRESLICGLICLFVAWIMTLPASALPLETLPSFLGVAHSATGKVWRDRLGARGAARALAITQRYQLPEMLARVLAGRDVAIDAVADFLDPTIRKLMPDPYTVTQMEAAAKRIADAAI
jgi:hypothetical protein